ncbi:AAA-associated domain-containing protein [Streptomyces sp. R-74717]|uniref:AAA-associated domain-containing protein n=1 Tax=Streptomyces TaxID=1883 RepID=UPI00379539E1
MADRIVVLGSRPYGTIHETFGAGLDRPRDRNGAAFEELIDRVMKPVPPAGSRVRSWTGALEVDDILPQVDALDLLGFAKISGNDLVLIENGTDWAGAGVQLSKTISAQDSSGTCSLTTAPANRSPSS